MLTIETDVRGFRLRLQTSEELFSPRYVDRGTLAMLSVADIRPGDKVLDLGCGCGVVGIVAAKLVGSTNVVMVDNDPLAVELARYNAELNGVGGIRVEQSDGVSALDDTDFTVILSNPPYHESFAVPKRFIEKGFNRLQMDGRFYMVTKRRTWYKNKFISIFGGVKIEQIDGYFVFLGIKRSPSYARASKRT